MVPAGDGWALAALRNIPVDRSDEQVTNRLQGNALLKSRTETSEQYIEQCGRSCFQHGELESPEKETIQGQQIRRGGRKEGLVFLIISKRRHQH